VTGYGTNQIVRVSSKETGIIQLVYAVIGFTNHSTKTFTYFANSSTSVPQYRVLSKVGSEWLNTNALPAAGSVEVREVKVTPGDGFAFNAFVPTNRPCKIAFTYENGSKPSRAWQRLPFWIWTKLPWTHSWRIATTDVIDLSQPRR
jgi:hypothetical protein